MEKKYFFLVILFETVGVLIFQWTYTKRNFLANNATVNMETSRRSKENSSGIWPVNLDPVIDYRETPLPEVFEKEVKLYIDVEQFRANLTKSTKGCWKIKNLMELWKSQPLPATNFTAENDFNRIKLAIQCGGIFYKEFLSTPPKEKLYPFEVSYLSEPPMTDETRISSHVYSTLSLVNTSSIFKIGDTVTFVIKISDRKGRPKIRGGDRIKVWLRDERFNNSISAKVIDFDNGTYLATTILPWAGTVRIKAVLTFPREYLRAIVYSHRTLKCFIIQVGAYINSLASEGVPCSVFPSIPGYAKSELCNLTLLNGSPWYCGRPSKPMLGCSDFKLTRFHNRWLEPVVSSQENHLLKEHKNLIFKYLQGINNISLTVLPKSPNIPRLQDPTTPCHLVPPVTTWLQSTPSGYIHNGVWKPFICLAPDKISPSCFTNTKIVIIGDSNGRAFYNNIMMRSGCRQTIKAKWKKWHSELACGKRTTNFSLSYKPHSCPYYASKEEYVPYTDTRSTVHILDEIPSTGRFLIVFSLYLHLVSYHISAYENTLWPIKDALLRLFNRNQNVHVILRGPHVAQFFVPYPKGDNLAPFIEAIQKKVFRDIWNKILFFPTWDMTVAFENTKPHPKCNEHIAHLMLALMCNRTSTKAV